MKETSQNGRSMIEMLGVLAIIGVLSVGGIAGYSKAMEKYRVNKTINQISNISANVRILFGSQDDYSALDNENINEIIKKAKLFPEEMIKTKTKDNKTTYKYVNPFGGEVTIRPAGRYEGDDDRSFVVRYIDIPREACIALATVDWDTGSGGSMAAFAINREIWTSCGSTENTDGKGFGTGGFNIAWKCSGSGPMSVSDATWACNRVKDNFLEFKFY